MADFLTTRGLSHQIEEIIKNARSHIYLVTPYIQLSPTIIARLKHAAEKDIEINIIYGKSDLNPKEQKAIDTINCNLFYLDKLHAKCYANDHEALISTMNLYTYSEVNNYEVGVLLGQRKDRKALRDCMEEIEVLLKTAQPIKVKQGFQPKEHSTQDEIKEAWHKRLREEYPDTTFIIGEYNTIEANDFPLQGIDFSTKYGFASLSLNNGRRRWQISEERKKHTSMNLLNDYRVFWKEDKVHLYGGNTTTTLRESLDYCIRGLRKITEVLKETETKLN